VLEILAQTFENVVVDCPHTFSEIVLEIFDRTSTILLVVEPSVPSVRAARRSLEIFHKLNYMVTQDRVRLVVNRASGQSEVTTAQIAETLGLPLFAEISNDYNSVIRAINAGKPVCEFAPESRSARDLVELARRLGRQDESTEPTVVGAVAQRQRSARFRLFGWGKAT
jgi:pilus assembly protein CpaE